MARPRAKEHEREETRERILAAARDLVVDGGFDALTMRGVAERVAIAPGTIYLYFGGRDDVARELCRRGYRELLAAMEPVAERVKDPARRLAALLEAYARFGAEHPETYRLIFMADAKFAAAVFHDAPIDEPGTGGLRAFGFIVEALRELKADGRLARSASVTRLAEVLWTSAHGAVSIKLTCPTFPATPVEELVAATVRVLLAGLPGARPS